MGAETDALEDEVMSVSEVLDDFIDSFDDEIMTRGLPSTTDTEP